MSSSRRIRPTAWMTCVAPAVLIFALGPPAAAQDQPPMPGPTAEHELLKKDVGTWDATVTIWPAPGAEPMKSQCTEKTSCCLAGYGGSAILRAISAE